MHGRQKQHQIAALNRPERHFDHQFIHQLGAFVQPRRVRENHLIYAVHRDAVNLTARGVNFMRDERNFLAAEIV